MLVKCHRRWSKLTRNVRWCSASQRLPTTLVNLSQRRVAVIPHLPKPWLELRLRLSSGLRWLRALLVTLAGRELSKLGLESCGLQAEPGLPSTASYPLRQVQRYPGLCCVVTLILRFRFSPDLSGHRSEGLLTWTRTPCQTGGSHTQCLSPGEESCAQQVASQ